MKKIKKIIIGIISLIVAPIIIIMLLLYQPVYKTDTVVFITDKGEVPVTVEIADTPAKHARGLMNRSEMDYNSGMLFIFGNEATRSFWMKNTLIPLDMIFIDSNYKIVNITKQAQPCKTIACEFYPSGVPAAYVVEVNGGFVDEKGIKIGDEIKVEMFEN